MKKKMVLALLASAMVFATGCGKQTEISNESNTITESSNFKRGSGSRLLSEADSEADTKSDDFSSLTDILGKEAESVNLDMGVYEDENVGMVPRVTVKFLPKDAYLSHAQYWQYDKKGLADFDVYKGDDDPIDTVEKLSEVNGAVWSTDIGYKVKDEERFVYISLLCQKDWELAKAADSDEKNYKEETYNGYEYITYDPSDSVDDGDAVDTVYASVKLEEDYYLNVSIDTQKNGEMLAITDKEKVIKDVIDGIEIK